MTILEKGVGNARLQLHFDVSEPVELMDLTLSFHALAAEYKKHLNSVYKSNNISRNTDDGEVKLYITSIENNCILAEFGPAMQLMGQLFTVADHLNTFVEFTSNIKKTIDYFLALGQKDKVDSNELVYSKADSQRVSDFLNVVAKTHGSKLGISAIEYDSSYNVEKRKYHTSLKVTYSSEEAHLAKRGALMAIEAMEKKTDADHKGVAMYFYQTNTDDPKVVGATADKVVIEDISDKPLKAYFVSELDQQRIIFDKNEPEQNPFKQTYIVDVNVQHDRNNRPICYRVIKIIDVLPLEE